MDDKTVATFVQHDISRYLSIALYAVIGAVALLIAGNDAFGDGWNAGGIVFFAILLVIVAAIGVQRL